MSDQWPVSGAELLKRVRSLAIAARRNVSSQFAGNYITGVRGAGMEFHEARHYQPGDPIRSIDWNMTARSDEAWVRTYLEEREREVIVAIDVSPSMFTGWQARTKYDTAMEIAATIAVSTEDVSDKIGWLFFSDELHQLVLPNRGGAHLHRMLRCLVERQHIGPPYAQAGSDPRAAIHAIQRFRGRRFIVFLISDFMDHDVPDDLAYVRTRHDVSLFHIYDPFEYAQAGPVRFVATAPEGTANPQSTRLGIQPDLHATVSDLKRSAAKHRMLVESISTKAHIGPTLSGFFHKKGRHAS